MSSTPGAPSPGQAERTSETLEATVDTSATGTTRIGSVVGDNIEVNQVRVIADDTAFDFNIENEGSDLFGSEQSPTGSPESFVPDQNATVGADGASLVADVSSAGSDSTVHIAVSVTYNPPN